MKGRKFLYELTTNLRGCSPCEVSSLLVGVLGDKIGKLRAVLAFLREDQTTHVRVLVKLSID